MPTAAGPKEEADEPEPQIAEPKEAQFIEAAVVQVDAVEEEKWIKTNAARRLREEKEMRDWQEFEIKHDAAERECERHLRDLEQEMRGWQGCSQPLEEIAAQRLRDVKMMRDWQEHEIKLAKIRYEGMRRRQGLEWNNIDDL